MNYEDAIATVNSLIAEAREVTGVDPQHMKLYCIPCGVDVTDCSCGEEDEEEPEKNAQV